MIREIFLPLPAQNELLNTVRWMVLPLLVVIV